MCCSELATTTFGFPKVVGVEWRIDYVVKSRHLEKVIPPCLPPSWHCAELRALLLQSYKPGYIVTLHTLDNQASSLSAPQPVWNLTRPCGGVW